MFSGHFSVVTVGAGYRSSCRMFAVLVSSVACVLSLCAGVAQAEAPRLVSYGSFPASNTALGVAVDNTSDSSAGDVYVASVFESNLNKFDASGKPVPPPPPSPFGEGDYSGAVVDPTNGDLYVVEALNFETFGAKLATYTSSGAPVGTPFEVPTSRNIDSPFFTVVQIATDSAGHVYVPVVPENKVVEYEAAPQKNAPPNNVLKVFTGTGGSSKGGELKGPTGVAVDSSGNVWVADTGNKRIEELNPTSDEPIGETKTGGSGFNLNGEGVESIALDGRGDVFVIVKNSVDFCGSVASPCSHLVEYNAAGIQVADVGAGSFETGEGPHPLPPMVAVNEASGRVYVTDAKGEKVWVFGPPVSPRVEKEVSIEVGTSEAKLGALVNPGGIETTYRFEYGTTTAYGQSTPFPEGSVGEGLASHAVWAAASGLAPGTTYHYRVVATSELGQAKGSDQTFTTETTAQAACPNEALRGGFSASLPDCRAYELVTATTKTSVQIESGGAAAPDGNAIAFKTHEPLPGAPTGGNFYVVRRGSDRWISEDVIPLESYTGAICVTHSNIVKAYSDALSRVLVIFGHDTRASEPGGSELEKQECNAEGVQAVIGEPVGYMNLLLRDNASGAYRLVNAPPPGVTPADANFKGASADLSHVIFSELAALTPEAPFAAVGGPEDLYEWDEGALRLLSVLPDGTPTQGSLAEASNGSRPISPDGTHILFTSGGGLYMRVNGERTVQVDESQGPGVSGGGSFQALSADQAVAGGLKVSKVFFLDENELTADSTAVAGQPDLYECVLPEAASRCELSDLTVARAGEHADVSRVSGLGSKDSSHVYFVAKGVLAANKREYTYSEDHKIVEGAESGQDNLYLWDGATTTFVARLTEGDSGVGAVSPDGEWFGFVSSKSLTGYENTPPEGGPVEEIFLYSASSKKIVCASCNPSGEATIAGAGANLASFAQRPLSDGGRLFFETREALVPSDTNGQLDVYEYESGQPSLISSGTSAFESKFQGASESGDDVFFLSRQQLVPQDTEEGARVIYDAHVGGGFAAPFPPPSCTTADACRVPVSPPPSIFGSPTSATFSGAGNLAPSVEAKAKLKSKPAKCKKGFVKKKGRCVRRSKKAGKSAHANKRTGK